ncbi:hypothetical protein BKA67DRAFT_536205 [Truncatella angustata]|uniref:Uncharacterized protein n=1 Tax=Truncatella angustata TaxID=152316 RepID=A0A9P8UMH3_9PEZI|nr:uncharacterized protein BKA67DRAFT_536205 [Truncatella angustata]KAH6654914.1 hypothetical protein BKA67DRAFT_536205 [Truncatella angustata]
MAKGTTDKRSCPARNSKLLHRVRIVTLGCVTHWKNCIVKFISMATSLPNQRSGLRKGRLKIVVAIDFGTTYSGIAYANTDEGFQAEKEAKKGVKLHEWFKLGLCPEYEKRRATASELIRKYRSSTALPTLNTISNYEQLVVDYLKSLKGHLDEQLASVYKLVK